MRTTANDRAAMRAAGARFTGLVKVVPERRRRSFETMTANLDVPAPVPSARKEHLNLVAAEANAKAATAEAEANGAMPVLSGRVLELANERIIGGDDLKDLNYLELALAVARGVARIRMRNGSASGSLVAPGILLTNNHVFPTPEAAARSSAQFDYQEPLGDRPFQVHSFAFEPGRFFLTDARLDFTFVAVAPRADTGRPLSAYPWTRLIETLGKSEAGEPVNIIQHPLGGWKRIALRDNKVLVIPNGRTDFLYYSTDTERGSSGSPCFNDQWEVIALHHQGVPAMRGNDILKVDGTVWNDADDPRLIDWVANEGARVSAIVDALKGAPGSPGVDAARRAILDSVPPNPIEVFRTAEAAGSQAGPTGGVATVAGSGTTFTVPLTISVSLGGAPRVAIAGGDTARQQPDVLGGTSSSLLESVVIDPDWAARKGYDETFIGPRIPLPTLSARMKAKSVKVPAGKHRPGNEYVLDYHHYSVAMNSERRFAWYSAAIVDGSKRQEIPDRTDKWFIDERIDLKKTPKFQYGEELYSADKTDRGHLTRYLDVAWGDTPDEAMKAASDSFHFTNCCLQLSGFNQSRNRWQGLEQFLLEQKARRENRRLIVFTGPVLKATDPLYRNEKMTEGARVPLSFWKVCVIERPDRTLSATAFLMGQEDVRQIPGFLEAFDAIGAQTRVEAIERLTGLRFGTLKQHDHLKAGGTPGTLEAAEFGATRAIRDFEDIEV